MRSYWLTVYKMNAQNIHAIAINIYKNGVCFVHDFSPKLIAIKNALKRRKQGKNKVKPTPINRQSIILECECTSKENEVEK